MEYYIRRVKVEGLFDRDSDLTVDFTESINCIYGLNGTGKTLLINLIVDSIRCNSMSLLSVPFESISILIAKSGGKQPLNYIKVFKYNGSVFYRFNDDIDLVKEIGFKISSFKNLSARVDYRVADGEKGLFLYTSQDDSNESFVSDSLIRLIISSKLSLTYVPLFRYGDQKAIGWNGNKSKYSFDGGFSEDPVSNVLIDLQEEFQRRYAVAQSQIARKLESLSSLIFRKLLLDSSSSYVHERNIQDLIDNDKGEVSEEQVLSIVNKVEDLKIDITEHEIRNHYNNWSEMKTRLRRAIATLRTVNENEDIEVKSKIFREHSDAYFSLLASESVFNKFENAIKEIESVYLKKQMIMSPFNMFRDEVNDYLTGDKCLDFDDSGEFKFFNNDRELSLSKLSSGEKHFLAILGRVSFSSASGVSTFITDEPELSLHLAWQRKILPSISKLSPSTQVIVATHAPAIISGEANMIDIEGCYKYA